MKKKVSEAEFKRIMPHYDTCVRKFRDVCTCQFCHRFQYKSDALPDHMIVRDGQSYLVEVKQSNGHWSFADRTARVYAISNVRPCMHGKKNIIHAGCFYFLAQSGYPVVAQHGDYPGLSGKRSKGGLYNQIKNRLDVKL